MYSVTEKEHQLRDGIYAKTWRTDGDKPKLGALMAINGWF